MAPVFIEKFPDRQVELKSSSKILNQIGVIHLLFFVLPQGGYRIFIVVYPCLLRPCKQGTSFSS